MVSSVFVSGASGYIAQHICNNLLKQGYRVVGSVRSPEKGDHISNLFNSSKFTYEVVPDIEPEGAFDEALKKHRSLDAFLHLASPFTFKAKDVEKELLNPAVNGTTNALKSIQNHGSQISKVIVTSSHAAMFDASKAKDPSYADNEESWNPITWKEAKTNPQLAFIASKKYAEKAAWDFVAKEKPTFSLNTINPVFVFGPQAFDSEARAPLNTSSEIIARMLRLKPTSKAPGLGGYFVDVRDVADAQIAVLEKDLSNKRLVLASEKFAGQDLIDILNANFESLRGKIPTGNPGTGAEIRNQLSNVDNTKTNELLKLKYTDLETSLTDMVRQLLAANK
ncbi:NAD(P)-binding protein [Metschnikowia bicuspidata var. bicuspidata NRRL YB-4993]|uniref:NAD(P)-binding protein n=1 Tax=Metschnikowia bicuspidata var. bicuspidata NRRL YB-4993 TaxID=869754 RepID=A0A1A0HGX0_9ASCO|nr:NAD(P)-binding protein [Metschnikowia bicuspidata var. bicuspidata NRRL YB-4993]OBA23424.1 NAD(P)-binding protein [Metschnikowia bicuspidata var. bicuspidata NRRL YB-4993]